MKKPFFIACGITLLVILAAFLFPRPFQLIDNQLIDLYFRARGPVPTQDKIVLAVIDEKSLGRLGRWPWPRSVMARVINKMGEAGAQGIGFDITFAETSPDDKVLAEALKKVPNAHLGFFFYQSRDEFLEASLSPQEIEENDAAIHPARLSLSSNLKRGMTGRRVFGAQSNVPAIAEAVNSERQGFFNVFPDPDGVIREMPLVLFYKDNLYPSLSLQMIGAALDFSPVPVIDEGGTLRGLAVGETLIPVNTAGEITIHYRGPSKTFPHVSLSDILEGKGIEKLKDKIVLVGATAIGIGDLRVTPFEVASPGMEIHANVIDSVLAEDFLVTNTATRFLSFGLILLVGLLLGLGIPRLNALASFLAFFLFMTLFAFTGYFFFTQKGWLIYLFKPALNALAVYGGITVYRYVVEERERRKIKKTFQHYLSPILIKRLLKDPAQLKLGGERKELTVLFSDIRNFTGNSERLPPEKVVQLLNDYFTAMTEIVFKYGGTLDKYMGDAIMAIYGAPLDQTDHPLRAVLTAMEMQEVLQAHKADWCQKYGFEDLKIGVGIHTGPMAVGNMGSAKRFNYTVIGDAVNLASRLESLTKEYNASIIVSDTHYQLIKDTVEARSLGTVRVKGKKEATIIHEVLGKKAGADIPSLTEIPM